MLLLRRCLISIQNLTHVVGQGRIKVVSIMPDLRRNEQAPIILKRLAILKAGVFLEHHGIAKVAFVHPHYTILNDHLIMLLSYSINKGFWGFGG